jgi:alpha-methylacyl-CoA racemase
MAVGALEPAFYSEFVTGLGLDEDDLSNRFDPENWSALSDAFGQAFMRQTREHWQYVFDGTDACVTPVLAMSEVHTHPQNQARPQEFSEDLPPSDGALATLLDLGLSVDQVEALVDDGVVEFR